MINRWLKKGLICLGFILMLTLVTWEPAMAQTTGPWKPGLTHRPRLLWEAAQWPAITSRLNREPYITLYNRVVSVAGRTVQPAPALYDASREYLTANIAKNAAFVWAVESDSAYGEKAAQILETEMSVDFTWSGLIGLYDLIDDDVHVSEAMQGYLAAYDILAGTGYISSTREQAIHDRVETMFVNAWQFYLVDFYFLKQVLSFNNHFTKLASAFGSAAITLNDSNYATEWINLAMAWGTYRLFDVITTPRGTFSEGPSYMVYAAVNHIPFFLQYDRFTNGEDATFQKRQCNLFGQNCTYSPVFISNPLENAVLLNMSKWWVDIRMPNGMCPPTDDSFEKGFFNGLMAGALGDGELAWDWLNTPGSPYNTVYCADLSADMICTYDDSITPVEPTRGPSIVNDEDAYAVFRTDWSEDADYAILLAENGVARIGGSLHEQADNLSFIYYSQRQMLAIDPGYIRWEERQLVRYGVDHNIVAVNGAGPPAPMILPFGGVDAFIRLYDLADSPQFAVANATYAQTDWVRAFFFYDGLALVGDFLQSDQLNSYDFLLHGNGGGDTGGTYTPLSDGARWDTNGVSFDLTLVASEPVTHSSYEDYHGWVWNQKHTHEVHKGSIDAAVGGFAAALVPANPIDSVSIAPLSMPAGCGGLHINGPDGDDYLLVDRGTSGCTVNAGFDCGISEGGAWVRPIEGRAVVFGSEAILTVENAGTVSQTNGLSMKVDWSDSQIRIEPDSADRNILNVQLDGTYDYIEGPCVGAVRHYRSVVQILLDDSCPVTIHFTPVD